ncbi:MAG: protein kinase [Polyangiaceae bacterium]
MRCPVTGKPLRRGLQPIAPPAGANPSVPAIPAAAPAPSAPAASSGSGRQHPVIPPPSPPPPPVPAALARGSQGQLRSARPAPMMPPANNPADPGSLIGRVVGDKYGVRAIIGEGGMGAVYEAEHLQLGRLVALKVLHPINARRSDAVARFHHEARVAGSIGHPNICEIYDVGKLPEGSPYLVMERLFGETLSDRITKEGALPFGDVIDIVMQVLSALIAAHEKGVVHRDIKPENIFLTQRVGVAPVAKLLDFGISKVGSSDEDLHLTKTGMVMGTPFYMAPEQARGDRTIDHRVDLYAVGVILYESLTGRRPFTAPNYNALLVMILSVTPKPMREIRPALPPGFDAIVEKALAKNREARFQNAKDFLDALAQLRDALARVPSTTDNKIPVAPRRSSRPPHRDSAMPPSIEIPIDFGTTGSGPYMSVASGEIMPVDATETTRPRAPSTPPPQPQRRSIPPRPATTPPPAIGGGLRDTHADPDMPAFASLSSLEDGAEQTMVMDDVTRPNWVPPAHEIRLDPRDPRDTAKGSSDTRATLPDTDATVQSAPLDARDVDEIIRQSRERAPAPRPAAGRPAEPMPMRPSARPGPMTSEPPPPTRRDPPASEAEPVTPRPAAARSQEPARPMTRPAATENPNPLRPAVPQQVAMTRRAPIPREDPSIAVPSPPPAQVRTSREEPIPLRVPRPPEAPMPLVTPAKQAPAQPQQRPAGVAQRPAASLPRTPQQPVASVPRTPQQPPPQPRIATQPRSVPQPRVAAPVPAQPAARSVPQPTAPQPTSQPVQPATQRAAQAPIAPRVSVPVPAATPSPRQPVVPPAPSTPPVSANPRTAAAPYAPPSGVVPRTPAVRPEPPSVDEDDQPTTFFRQPRPVSSPELLSDEDEIEIELPEQGRLTERVPPPFGPKK